MYRNKKDIDKHVENLRLKLSDKEFKTRAYSVARLYFEVGDYASCQKYVEQYLTLKDNNAAAHKLLGQTMQKLGQKEKALDQYKISLEIDPNQTSLILNICELLTNDDLLIDPGRAKYWCEKAEAIFPKHPVTFHLREKLLTLSNPDSEAVIELLTSELDTRPKDAILHIRLLKYYLQTNKINEAFEHACKIELSGNTFINNYDWYETLEIIIKHNSHNINNCLYQILLLTVREHLCNLSITETPLGTSKGLVESNELLHLYDQAIQSVVKAGVPPGHGELHASLLHHHKGQLAFHIATFLLKKAKKNQLSWHDAIRTAEPLMLIAWHTVPLDPKVNWLIHSPEKQQHAVYRWYIEGSYRCSQSGHFLLTNNQDKTQSLLDHISQNSFGPHWRDKLYEKIFPNRDHKAKVKTSYLVSNAFESPALRLPKKIEVEAYDTEAQKTYPNSLHHFVWILMNYKEFAHFKCSLFDMLIPKPQISASCGPETLNKLDILAFLYCSTLSARLQKINYTQSYYMGDRPILLPANITDLLCPLSQVKWWDCAYKYSQNELGTELTDIRATLTRGLEVIRCLDNHGLDPELLCVLGHIFREKANIATTVDDKNNMAVRARLYYSSALPFLEKLKNKILIKLPERRLFDYTHKDISNKELNNMIEECKLYIALHYINDYDYEKAIGILSNLNSAPAYYHLSEAYAKMALEDSTFNNEPKYKHGMLLSKAKKYAYKALSKLKERDISKNQPLDNNIHTLIEDIETHLNKLDYNLSDIVLNDNDEKYSSDENISVGNDNNFMRSNTRGFRNLSSTPKQLSKSNVTHYRTAVESQIHENTRADQQFLESIENQIRNLQRRDSAITDFMEQTKNWFDENRKLGNQIINTIHNNMQNTTEQFKLLKISVDQVKDQIDECKSECKDVCEIKKQIAELKKEVNKIKKVSSEQTVNENDLYNLDDDYRTNENTSTFAAQLPFAPTVMPTFNQRLVPPFPIPPNPYQLYGQNLYNFYNQYHQFPQPPTVPGAPPPIFDGNRSQVNYPGVYPTPDQMYIDIAHLVPPTGAVTQAVHTAMPISTMSSVTVTPTAPIVSVSTTTSSVSISKSMDSKEIPRSLPVNVVITSSDPLPTCTTVPAPILSVTIPPKHIKGIAHNYQIPMPSTNDTKILPPPLFTFPSSGNKLNTTSGYLTNWDQSNVFKSTQISTFSTVENSTNDKSVADSSPNVSLNKSRTLSEKSNTSVENYDPCPDFKPIIPLPAEVKVTTGEEDETVIFNSRAKLFRFVDKQWKERGLGEMKLLKHKMTGKVRVLMRREQVHKICANHIITCDMEIKPMKNETKAYFWVANDFADEKVILEKFCIRFKTAELAQNFYEKFEKARQESKICNDTLDIDSKEKNLMSIKKDDIKTLENVSEQPFSQSGKTVLGGFTFSSTPNFKSLEDTDKTDIRNPSESVTSKANIFSTLTFKTNTSSPFSALFTNTSAFSNNSSPTQKQDITNILNTSDVVEEFEPSVEFKPVIPLPALVETKTGEENEIILFEHRSKLLRFETSSKEWKERGLGNIKLLVDKDNVLKVRLLMRREQVKKVCCNHAITEDMVFQKMPNMDKAVTWCAMDFAEGELIPETFCLRFKTVEVCDDFIQAIKLAQSKMKNKTKVAKEEQNAVKQNEQLSSKLQTNNQTDEDTKASSQNSTPLISSGWGDKFKPKSGTWECQLCFIRNDENMNYCCACNSPKDPNMEKKEEKVASVHAPQFKFGISSQTNASVEKNNEKLSSTVALTSTWGGKFKPKDGTWECVQCFVRNESHVDNCSACDNLNPNSVKNEANPASDSVSSAPKFNFGIPPAANIIQKPNTTSMFDGTGAHKFNFGIPPNAQDRTTIVVSFGASKLTSTVFGASKASNANESPTLFYPKQATNVSTRTETSSRDENNIPIDFSKKNNDLIIPSKPALLPTPTKDINITFGGKESGTFDFVFKPKSPVKGKSPGKSPKSEKGEDSDGNEYASEDEGHHIHFSPVIPMPDKVEVVTGEENELELYGHRAKLFRFITSEWKERGIGIVKILKHKETGNLRVLMRREQVLKICLNHTLTPEITYTPKDDKTWLFAANDFSEGELSLQQFCLRFKTKEIAREFKDAIDKARDGKAKITKDSQINVNHSENDDVIFVGEIQATTEEKVKAKELMLPENFFTYKNKDPCQGCRGCKDDDDTKDHIKISTLTKNIPKSSFVTPVKTTDFSFKSPTNSIYGTPTNINKTLDNSVFRTPLESVASNTKSTPNNTKNESSGNISFDKENSFMKSNFPAETVNKPLFGTPQNKANDNLIGDTQTPVSTKSVILAAPKLCVLNTSGSDNQNMSKAIVSSKQDSVKISETDKQVSDAKTIFAQAMANEKRDLASKPVIEPTNPVVSEKESIFTDPNLMSKASLFSSQQPEIKSIFGGNSVEKLNLFSGASQGSIFGPGAFTSNNTIKSKTGDFLAKPATTSSQIAFSFGKSIFETIPSQTSTWKFGTNTEPIKTDATNTNNDSTLKKTDETKNDDVHDKKDMPLSDTNNLSFATLSSSGPGFVIQKNPDFKWEGTGQQLFVTPPKNKNNEIGLKSDNTGDAEPSGGDEEYDPHYEPIVPLPDKIVVTTGEEDEECIFCERCKLYRYDEKSREWKERGVGNIKILHHPEKNTYRMLLRREQVYKAVLNMLVFMDMELLPMKNSDRAWTWAGRNYAENASGEQETLAVRFKSMDLATAFRDKVVECVRKLQAAAAKAIREGNQADVKKFDSVPKLRLPKHLQDDARADNDLSKNIDKSQQLQFQTTTSSSQKEQSSVQSSTANTSKDDANVSSPEVKQVHFSDTKEEENEDNEEEHYEYGYGSNEDYEAYYNEEEEETAAYYSCDGEVVFKQGAISSSCSEAHIQVLFDQEIYSPKIMITDSNTGEILADMLIHTDTEFDLIGDSCTWSGTDYTSNHPLDKTVTVNFHDNDTAIQFYDSCETSKAATYSSGDPES